MASLIAQTAGVLVAAAALYGLARRARVPVRPAHAAIASGVVVLAVLSVSELRDGWDRLDDQRERYASLDADPARAACVAPTRVDPRFLEWVRRRLPERSAYYLELSDDVEIAGGGTCIRYLLLPRLDVGHPGDARYAVLWGSAPRELLEDAKRRGGVVERFAPGFAFVRMPG